MTDLLPLVVYLRPFEPSSAVVLLVIGILLVISAAMSASEVALFSLSPTHLRDIQERGGSKGKLVLDLLSKPRRLLATILIANNFVNVGIVILSTVAVADIFDLTQMTAWTVFAIQVIAVTFVLLLVGEVVPKVYAASDPVRPHPHQP